MSLKESVKISVIIPIYNAAGTLEKCIGSVRAQTLKNMEILCVNDGSTDGSGEILSRLEAEDKRIRVFRQENKGAGAARNLALYKAEGEYIAFADADDYWLDTDALERMYCAAKREGTDIVGSLRCMEQNGTVFPMSLHRSIVAKHVQGVRIAYRDYQYDYHFQSYIYKRRILEEKKIEFPDLRRFQDPPFFVKAMLAASDFWVERTTLLCYQGGHMSYSYSSSAVADIVRGITMLLELSAAEGLKELHALEVDRLNTGFFWDILEQCLPEGKNGELYALMRKADKTVRWDWIASKTEKPAAQRHLRILEWLETGTPAYEYEEIFAAKHQYGYPVCWYRLRPGQRVVLYAAGTVGKAYYRQFSEHSKYRLVLWADASWKSLKAVDGRRISPPEEIRQAEYDIVLIAVEEEKTARRIKNDLVRIGVSEDKIVWGP